jgi:hypothetical protein
MLICENLPFRGATVRVHVERAYGYDEERGLWLYRQEEPDEEAHNLVTNAGRDQLHLQGYGTSGLATNGFNYIALSNDATAPAVGDTALAGELSGNGLSRVQGVVSHTAGTNTTTIAYTFTYTGSSQAIQKTALFNASSVGTMNHEIAFTQRTLFTNDTITLTFTITLG